jgi:hypothetical protein
LQKFTKGLLTKPVKDDLDVEDALQPLGDVSAPQPEIMRDEERTGKTNVTLLVEPPCMNCKEINKKDVYENIEPPCMNCKERNEKDVYENIRREIKKLCSVNFRALVQSYYAFSYELWNSFLGKDGR